MRSEDFIIVFGAGFFTAVFMFVALDNLLH